MILGRRRLRFNPYKVSDRQLLAYAMDGRWGSTDDLTQMVVMTFTRMNEVSDYRRYDGIYYRIGNAEDEEFMHMGKLLAPVTAHDTIMQTRSLYGKKPLLHDGDVERLVGRSVFISRLIHGCNIHGSLAVAYRMHRLMGDMAKSASIIRRAMVEAKIEMLERLLAHPESPLHLSCSKGLFDYETRVRRAIGIISDYPSHPVPQD